MTGSGFETSLAVISVVASIASLTLAVIAIWFAIKFFQLSSKQAERASEAATEISGAVQRLETLFDRMYSDTFGMVQSMQDRIWQMVVVPVGDSGASSLPDAPSTAPTNDEALAIESNSSPPSRREIREAQENILPPLKSVTKNGLPGLSIADLVSLLPKLSMSQIAKALFILRTVGDVTWDGSAEEIGYKTVVRLSKPTS